MLVPQKWNDELRWILKFILNVFFWGGGILSKKKEERTKVLNEFYMNELYDDRWVNEKKKIKLSAKFLYIYVTVNRWQAY